MTRGTIINIALCEDTRLSGRLEKKKKKSLDLDTWTSGNFQNKSFAWSHVGVVCWRTIPACAYERKNENKSSSSMSWQSRTNNPRSLLSKPFKCKCIAFVDWYWRVLSWLPASKEPSWMHGDHETASIFQVGSFLAGFKLVLLYNVQKDKRKLVFRYSSTQLAR